MGDFLTQVTQLVGGIFGDRRGAKLFTLVTILVVVMLGFFLWDSATGDFTLRATEKKIGLLSDLYALEQDGITSSAELAPLYQEMVQEVRGYKPALSVVSMNSVSPNTIQFIGGMLFWVLIALMMLFTNTANKSMTFIAAIVLGVMCGLFGMTLPDAADNGTNFLAGIGVQFGIVGLILIWQKVKTRREQQSRRVMS